MSVVSCEQILNYVNQARTSPQKFAQYVKTEMELFYKDNRTLPLVKGCDYSTNEGKGAWIQCKNYLESFKPVQPYQLSKSLCLVAEDHAADMAQNNFQGHTGSDGSSPSDRINRRCNPIKNSGTASGENIGGDFKYQGRNFALNTVKSLLIDDGVSSRGHRKNILSTNFKYIGIGSRVVGNKIRVVMVFHSHDPTLKSDHPPSKAGSELKFEDTHAYQQVPMQANFNMNMNMFPKMPGSEESGRKLVGKKTSSSSTTTNGKTVTKTVQILTYSDGSTERNETIKTG